MNINKEKFNRVKEIMASPENKKSLMTVLDEVGLNRSSYYGMMGAAKAAKSKPGRKPGSKNTHIKTIPVTNETVTLNMTFSTGRMIEIRGSKKEVMAVLKGDLLS